VIDDIINAVLRSPSTHRAEAEEILAEYEAIKRVQSHNN